MDNKPFTSYEIAERSFVSFVKREIHQKAVQADFNPSRVGTIDIIVSELTSNIIKHAGHGELLYRFSDRDDCKQFEIICIDGGEGIKDIAHSMKDGVSTTKTLGQGLGAMERMSDVFQVYSIVKWGTVCYSKVYAEADKHFSSADSSPVKCKALNVSKPGQTVSGDGYDIIFNPGHTKIFMGDGLGHGKEAHDAVQLAISSFRLSASNDPASILRYIHDPVKKSRGLVGAVAVVDHRLKKWKICGVGNITTRIYEGLMAKNYVSYNGIIGLNIPTTLKNHEVDLSKHQCLIMSSDGIRTRWDLSQFPAILRYDPIMLAAVIYKESARKTDDMSILIART
jgi:anti-sigma regulatory factor (Ser/Thr protein kinase)